jgi:hypothetical protein
MTCLLYFFTMQKAINFFSRKLCLTMDLSFFILFGPFFARLNYFFLNTPTPTINLWRKTKTGRQKNRWGGLNNLAHQSTKPHQPTAITHNIQPIVPFFISHISVIKLGLNCWSEWLTPDPGPWAARSRNWIDSVFDSALTHQNRNKPVLNWSTHLVNSISNRSTSWQLMFT